jgi:hypothetical protein
VYRYCPSIANLLDNIEYEEDNDDYDKNDGRNHGHSDDSSYVSENDDGYATENSCDFDNEFLKIQIPPHTGALGPSSANRSVLLCFYICVRIICVDMHS